MTTMAELRRQLFMTPAVAARYAWFERRKPGTRLERCERLYALLLEEHVS